MDYTVGDQPHTMTFQSYHILLYLLIHDVQSPQIQVDTLYRCVDADWVGNTKNRKSVSRMALFLAGAPIAYKSKMQPTIALSSTENEFIAASSAGKMVLYLSDIIDSMNLPQVKATTIYEDSTVAIAMANYGKPTRRMRHVLELRHSALLQWI